MEESPGPRPQQLNEDTRDAGKPRQNAGRLNPRKLLRVTVGLAAVSYLGTGACTSKSSESPDVSSGGGEEVTGSGGKMSTGYYGSGNLMAPEPDYDDCSDSMEAGGAGGGGGEGGSCSSKTVR